ncbi:MAG TPA: type II toxin-antitoxin system prevent-host-death family antitoxin [Candidatus Acidoferrales bacterium]|nr:type II toxin-antitoxin system prevent-host-death family antitoxin [Candidatus Acidoferrales bacterium]
MEKAVTAADANRQFSKLIQAVKKGDSFIVTSHGEPIAKIIPIAKDLREAERKKAAFLEYLRNKPVTDIGPWTRDELYEETL